MNGKEHQPQKGFYVDGDKFNKMRGWSFTVSLNKEPVSYAMNGYESGTTHEGHKTELFVMLFNRTFAIGYNSVHPVKS